MWVEIVLNELLIIAFLFTMMLLHCTMIKVIIKTVTELRLWSVSVSFFFRAGLEADIHYKVNTCCI